MDTIDLVSYLNPFNRPSSIFNNGFSSTIISPELADTMRTRASNRNLFLSFF